MTILETFRKTIETLEQAKDNLDKTQKSAENIQAICDSLLGKNERGTKQ